MNRNIANDRLIAMGLLKILHLFEKSLQPMYAHEIIHIQQQIACLVPMVNMMQSMTPINYYTNYFCDNRRQRNEQSVILCIPDMPEVRAFADSLHLTTKLYFGENSDPVQIIPLHQIESCVKSVSPVLVSSNCRT